MSRTLLARVFLAGAALGLAGLLVSHVGAAGNAAHPDQAAPGPSEPVLYDDTVVRDIAITVPVSGGTDWLSQLGCVRSRRPGGGSSTVRKDVAATVTVDGVTLSNVGVRCKGNSSLNISGTKKPINVTFDSFVPGQDIWGIEVLNLNNNWSDPSQLREAIALRLMSEYQPVSRFTFARVTMNGKVLGLYAAVEQINAEWADYWYPDDGGSIIKGDNPTQVAFNSSTLNWKGENLASYKSSYEAKGAAAATDEAYEDLREFIRKLDAPASSGGLSDAAFPDGIRQVLDVESALWYIATSNLLANFDSYYVGKNYYLYFGQRDPRVHVVPWDLGLSFALFGIQNAQRTDAAADEPAQWPAPPSDPGSDSARVDPFVQSTEQNRPLIRRLLAVPSYRADYLAHYRALLAEVFTTDWIGAVGTRYQDLVREAAREELTAQGRISGAFTFEQFLSNLTTDLSSGGDRGGMGGNAPGILALVSERRAYLAGLSTLVAPDLSLAEQGHDPAKVTAADPVLVRARFSGTAAVTSVQVRYRLDGGFENIVPATAQGSGAWRATIPPARQGTTVSYVIRAETADGAAVFYPSATLTKPYTYEVAGITLPRQETGALVINEIMADNKGTIADESGKYPDWVELYNRGTAAIGLSGYFLSDDEQDPHAYALPDRQLPAGGRLLVWCDNDPDEGELHAPFRLGADGEEIFLATTSAILESVAFPATQPDQSYMRLPDGSDQWVLCAAGTPNEANACEGGNLRTPGAPPSDTPTQTAASSTPTAPAPHTSTPSATVRLTPTGTATTPSAPSHRAWLPMLMRP